MIGRTCTLSSIVAQSTKGKAKIELKIKIGVCFKVTGYSLLINVYEKMLPSFYPCRIQACMHLTLPLKKVALACNSCTGWVGRAGNLIAVLAVNGPHMKY